MPVTEILLLRHGHRIAWSLDPTTGKYSSNHPFPTKLPADPPLASHGVDQAVETGKYFENHLLELVRGDRLRIYSSLFYRCLQTLQPTVEALQKVNPDLVVRGERGFSEWFGKAWFDQPVPAHPRILREKFYPWLDASYESLLVPERKGERIHELHERIAKAFHLVVSAVDEEYQSVNRGSESVTLLICGHAAQIICSGRVLTGTMPEDLDEEDFLCYTCGISKFVRRQSPKSVQNCDNGLHENGGVLGDWNCELNSWCGHLPNGEERGWHFHGDESFDSYGPGMKTGIITEDGTVSRASSVSSKL